jgi:hypothetical protein
VGMERLIDVLATIAAFLGLVDFFVPKARLEKSREALVLYLKHKHEQIVPANLLRRIQGISGKAVEYALSFSLLGAILTLIGWWGGKVSHEDDLHFWRTIGVIILFILFFFVVVPLIFILTLIGLKFFLRYLIWSPKGVTALITLPLACWALYEKLIGT